MTDEPTSPPRLIRSTRFTLTILISFALFNQYAQRSSLPIAIVCMVKHTSGQTMSPLVQLNNTTMRPSLKHGVLFFKEKQFPWTEFEEQILLGAHLIGYLITLVLGGWLSTKLGGKRIFAYCLSLSSMATFAIPMVYFLNNAHFLLILILRIIVGFAHGPLMPATYTLWSLWAVPLERATLIAISFCSTNLGSAVVMLFGGLLCRYVQSGWIYIFIFTSTIGFLWLPLWLYLVSDSPEQHKTISKIERDYICGKIAHNAKRRSISLASLPWKKIIRSKPTIALFISQSCNIVGFSFFQANIGKLFTQIFRLPVQHAGYILACGFVLMPIFSLSAGMISDRLARANVMTLTNIRKLFVSFASFIPAMCMVVLCFCDQTRQILGIIIVFVYLCFTAMNYGAGFVVNYSELTPAYSSSLFGISIAFGSLNGLLGNVLAGIIIKQPVIEHWRKLFILFATLYFVGGLIFILFGSAVPRKWGTLAYHEEQYRIKNKEEKEEIEPMQEPKFDSQETIKII